MAYIVFTDSPAFFFKEYRDGWRPRGEKAYNSTNLCTLKKKAVDYFHIVEDNWYLIKWFLKSV